MNSDFTLLLAILFFLVVGLSALGYVFLAKKASVFDPAIQFILFFSLLVLPLPIHVYQTKDVEGDTGVNLHLLLPYLPKAVFLCALSLPFFLLAYYSRSAKRIASWLPVPQVGQHARKAFLTLAGISVLLIAALARDSGGIMQFLLIGYNSTAEMYGKGYLAVGFSWLLVAPLFLLCRYAAQREKIDLLLFAGASAALIAMYLLMGDRHSIMYGGLAVLLFWHHGIRPVSLKKLGMIGLGSFLALNIVGQVRSSHYESLMDYWEKTTSAYDKQVADSPGTMFYTLTTGEFIVPFEALPRMMESVGATVNPQFGRTYLEAPLFFIPSAIFPNRPASLTHWYMETFYGSGYSLNEGRAFFFLAEGYLNFGYVGVFATMIGWGLFLGAARNYLQGCKGTPGAVLLYAITIAFIFRGIAGDFVSIFVGLPEQSLSAAIIGLWICNRRINNHAVAVA
jgi:hypothetical protein